VNLPAAQAVQNPLSESENVPAGHSLQVAGADSYLPGSQVAPGLSTQTFDPAAVLDFPSSHVAQVVDPGVVAKKLIGQRLHVVDPSLD
jgi:hypothetical protein